MEIMRIEHLSKVYGSGENAVRAVNDISFSIERGEFLAIIGRPAPENPRFCTFSAASTVRRRAMSIWTVRTFTRRTRIASRSSAAVRWG